MRFSRVLIFTFLSVVVSGSRASAQIDPSSALLLNNGIPASNRDSGLDSGRYTVRPTKPSAAAARKVDPDPDADDTNQVGEPHPATVPTGPTPVAAVATPPPQASTPVQATPAPSNQAPTAQIAPAPNAGTVSSSHTENSIEVGKPRRLSILQLGIDSGYMYNSSQSNFAYRNYSTSSPLLGVDAKVWISNGFALQTSYQTTLSGSVSDAENAGRNVSASQEWYTVGLRTRKFFGTDNRAPSLLFGLDYNEYDFDVPGDAQFRTKLQTSGVQLNLETDIPVSDFRSWTLGFSIAPKQSHTESPTTLHVSSGGNVDANTVSLSIGGRLGLDHSNGMFWKLSETIEKDLFSGQASAVDPVTGSKPTGVTVTNSWTMLQFGYTWGD